MPAGTVKEELRYHKVKRIVLGMVEGGELLAGSRAPSLRQLSKKLKLSLSTVLQAYMELEDEGVLESRPKSGFFVRQKQSLALPTAAAKSPKPEIIRKNSLILQVMDACSKNTVTNIGSAICAPELMPVQALHKAMQRALREEPVRAFNYSPNEGIAELRRIIAYRGLEAGGTEFDPDNIIVTNGGNEALLLALRCVTKPGDVVAIESPTYFGVIQSLESLGLKAVEIPTCMVDGVELDKLKTALDRFPIKACLFTANFNNPTGTLYPDEKKEALVKLLAARDIPLIEDDVYGDLYYGQTRPLACKHFDKKGMVLYCSSFSKTLAPGYRVGWLEPGKFFEDALKMKVSTSYATATAPQLAVADFVKTGAYERHLRKLRETLKTLSARYRWNIQRLFPEGTKISQPQGGSVLWVELPGKEDGVRLYKEAAKRGVFIVPGAVFTSREDYRNCIRLNYGRPWGPEVESGLTTVASLITRP